MNSYRNYKTCYRTTYGKEGLLIHSYNWEDGLASLPGSKAKDPAGPNEQGAGSVPEPGWTP